MSLRSRKDAINRREFLTKPPPAWPPPWLFLPLGHWAQPAVPLQLRLETASLAPLFRPRPKKIPQ